MKKRIWNSTKKAFRLAVLAMVVVSLVVTAAYPTVTVRVPIAHPVESPEVAGQNQILPGNPPPVETGDKMANGRKQQAAPCLVAVAPSTVKSDGGVEQKINSKSDHILPVSSIQEPKRIPEPMVLACVSPQVARQFTLVGAKPSGTM